VAPPTPEKHRVIIWGQQNYSATHDAFVGPSRPHHRCLWDWASFHQLRQGMFFLCARGVHLPPQVLWLPTSSVHPRYRHPCICIIIGQDSDFLHIQSITLNPDPPVPGDVEISSFIAEYSGSTTLTAGTVTIQTLCQGVQVFKLDLALCDVLKCPVKPGSTLTGYQNMTVPASAPPCAYEAKVDLLFYSMPVFAY
jgi:hypothetical protein